MIATLSSSCLIIGGCVACAALKRPNHQAAFERVGGMLMVAGLALLGTGLGLRP